MTTTQKRVAPPVIPEIAKAYQNDPQTQLALAAVKAGSSTAPVAQGGYAYADGIARALQGVMGGYMDKKQQDYYSHGDYRGPDVGTLKPGSPEWIAAQDQRGQDGVLAQRQARGVDGLTGAGASTPNPAAPAAPTAPQATPSDPPPPPGTLAAANGAVPILNGSPPAPAPMPAAPMPPPTVAPGMGAGPPRRPFVSAPSGADTPPPPALAPPKPDALGRLPVPDAPAPVARPVAPQAVGPTRSKLLDAAYRIMADANPYESAGGQDLYASGLTEQDKLNESAAEREQKLRDMGYQTDLGVFSNATSQDRESTLAERRAVEQNNFTAGQGGLTRSFEGSEKAKDRAATAANEAANRANALKVAGLRIDATYGTQEANDAINQAIADGRLDPMAVTTRNRASLGSFLASPGGKDASPLAIHAYAMGRTSEARAAGTRVGQTAVATSEVPGLAAEAQTAHAALKAQGAFVPWNRAVQAVQQHTSSPELARAVTATDAVAKAYARSFGSGVVAVSHYKDAQAKLQNTWGTPAFDAALNAMITTVNIERAGATAALDSTGKPTGGTPPAPASGGWGKATVVK